MSELVTYGVAGGVAEIVLNSPANRNALSAAMVAALDDALTRVADDADARVVVLGHEGPVFCAGVDLKEAKERGMTAATRDILGLLRALVALPKPVIARIGGPVRAGGLGIVGACDVAISADTVDYAFTEARIGVAPAIISLTTLPRMDPRRAHRWCLSGESFDAHAAADAGLISQAVAPDKLDGAVAACAGALQLASPQGLAETKKLLARPMLEAIDADGGHVVDLSAGLFASEEAAEGMQAFAQRRPPRWVAAT